jgi:hypothetical protein
MRILGLLVRNLFADKMLAGRQDGLGHVLRDSNVKESALAVHILLTFLSTHT